MPFPVLVLVVFTTSFVLDWIWALYIRRTSEGKALQAGAFAGLLFLIGVYNTSNWLHDARLILPMALGAALGTMAVVWHDHRKQVRNAGG